MDRHAGPVVVLAAGLLLSGCAAGAIAGIGTGLGIAANILSIGNSTLDLVQKAITLECHRWEVNEAVANERLLNSGDPTDLAKFQQIEQDTNAVCLNASLVPSPDTAQQVHTNTDAAIALAAKTPAKPSAGPLQ